MGRVKIKPADTAFSKVVREAYDYTCIRCHTKHERGSLGLHCSHIYGRASRTVRWCKDNAKALCFSCHQWFGANPADSGYWIRKLWGEDKMEILTEKLNSRIKVTKIEEKDIAKHYREQLKIIEGKRSNGETGYIDFVSWQ